MASRILNIQNKITYWLLIALAFFIPVYDKVSALIIGLLVLNWLLEGRFVHRFNLIKTEKSRRNLLLFSVLYLIHLIGLIYSKNVEFGLFDLEIKLSLLIFPLVFSTIDYKILEGKLKYILFGFLAGCFSTTLILLTRSFINFTNSLLLSEFFYGQLAWFHHSSYLAMFIVFSIGIMSYYLLSQKERLSKKLQILFTIGIIYFGVFIIFLSSKAGIISLALLILAYAGYIIFQKKYLKGVLILITSTIVFWLAFNYLPNVSSRINKAVDILATEKLENDIEDSTGERILVWKSSMRIIKENFLFGVGTGDVKDRLIQQYEKESISKAYQARLNAHNQYLQTFIALGFIGFLILILVLLLPLIISFKKRNTTYILFILLLSLNLLFESMLERQAGVVFYAFFNGLLFYYLNKDSINRVNQDID